MKFRYIAKIFDEYLVNIHIFMKNFMTILWKKKKKKKDI